MLDGSLGPAGPLTGPDYLIGPEHGARAGENLFHSLQQIRLDAGESAIFGGPAGVHHVLVRVTGGEASVIDGTLGTNLIDGGDLWLINPAGWLFGESARLNVQGSLHVSTAAAVRFAAGPRFAAASEIPSRLSVAPPAAFGFLTGDGATIDLDRAALQAPQGASLEFAADRIRMEHAALAAPDGEIALRADSGRVRIAGNPQTAEGLEIPSLDASGQTGGRIEVSAQHIALDDALIASQVFGEGGGGDIALSSAATLSLTGNTRIRADSYGAGAGGDIRIEAGELVMRDQARIRTAAHWQGAAGAIRLRVQGDLAMQDGALIEAFTQSAAPGGAIAVGAGALRMEDLATFRVATYGQGRAGDIRIQAEALDMAGDSTIDASAFVTSAGDAGFIEVRAGAVGLQDRALISNAAFGAGKGGPLSVESATLTLLDQAEIRALSRGDGPAGSLVIRTQGLMQVHGGRLTTESSNANGGPITVEAGALLLADAEILTSVLERTGDGGDITLSADHLVLDGGFIQANTAAAGGRGGDIEIQAGRVIPSRESLLVGGAERRSFEPGSGRNVIQAAAPQGVNGEIRILSPSLAADGLLGELSATPAPLPTLYNHPCAVVGGEPVNSLVRHTSPLSFHPVSNDCSPQAPEYR